MDNTTYINSYTNILILTHVTYKLSIFNLIGELKLTINKFNNTHKLNNDNSYASYIRIKKLVKQIGILSIIYILLCFGCPKKNYKSTLN